MSFSLKPHQLVAHWVPGFILLTLIPVLKPDWYCRVKTLLPADQVSRAFILIALPFVAGQLIDCLRNAFLEGLLDRWQRRQGQREVNWDFFFTGEAQRLENLERWFFDYYVFDLNLAVPSICFFLFRLFQWHWAQCLPGLAVTCLLVYDAWSLRKEIAKHTNPSNGT